MRTREPWAKWEASNQPLTENDMIRETTIEGASKKALVGCATVNNWTVAPDGETYLHFWADRWVVLTDQEVGQFLGSPGFRSSERWILVGYSSGPDPWPKIILPGCQVKALMACDAPPKTRNVYRVA